MSSKLQSQKMADTSKDELLLDGGINRITTTSRSTKQVPACVSNIALIFGNISIVCTNKIFNCCTVLMSSKLKFAIELQAVYLRCTTYLRMPLFGIIPVVTLFVVCAGAVNTTHTSNNNSHKITQILLWMSHIYAKPVHLLMFIYWIVPLVVSKYTISRCQTNVTTINSNPAKEATLC